MKSNSPQKVLNNIYDEIYTRFFYGMPALSDIRTTALFNEAYWFYSDTLCNIHLIEPKRQGEFQRIMTQRYHLNINDALANAKKVSRKVPRSGCVLVNKQETHVLLVHGNRYWGFPCGKIIEGESFPHAAIRETYEETSLRINEEQLDKEFFVKAKPEFGETHFFLVKGIDDRQPITPIAPGEVTFAAWEHITTLMNGEGTNEEQALQFYVQKGFLRQPPKQPENTPPKRDVFIHHAKEDITSPTFFATK